MTWQLSRKKVGRRPTQKFHFFNKKSKSCLSRTRLDLNLPAQFKSQTRWPPRLKAGGVDSLDGVALVAKLLDSTPLFCPLKKRVLLLQLSHTHTHTRENSRFVCPTHLLYPETIVIERLTEPGSPQVGEHGSQLLVKRIVEIEKTSDTKRRSIYIA